MTTKRTPAGACRVLIAAALATAALAGTVLAATPPAGETSGPQTLLRLEPDARYTRNSEGDILELKDGSLALVYTRFTGGDSDHSAADLAMRTSADGGSSWSQDRLIVPNEGGCNVMSVSLLRLPSDEILLFYLRKDSAAGSCNIYVRRSADELQTVSAPLRVSLLDGYHVMNNARVIRTSKGRIVAPAVLHSGFDGDETSATVFSPPGVPFVYYSDDDGRTWQRDETAIVRPDKKGPVLQENGVVELRDGALWMYMRTDQGSQFACRSSDHGRSWTRPEATALRSPLSPAVVKRVPWTGDLLAVWNDHSGLHPFPPKKRTPLCVALSRDDGRTWEPSRAIESNPDGWYCYTSVLFRGDRAILSYCAGDSEVGGLNRLKVTAIPPEWLLAPTR